MSLFGKLILATNLEYLTNVLMGFLLRKVISEIYEYLQKSEFVNAHSASHNQQIWDWPSLTNKAHYFSIFFDLKLLETS